MDTKTAEALEASIAKWKRNAEISYIEDATLNPGDCPLCIIFYRGGCIGCPVAGQNMMNMSCGETPYGDALNAYAKGHVIPFRTAALAEVAFLESLREPKEGGAP